MIIKQVGTQGTNDQNGQIGAIPVCVGLGWGALEPGPAGSVLTASSNGPAWNGQNYVLQFNGAAYPMQAYHGGFWPATTNLTGGFYWDFWVKPLTAPNGFNGYVISDGYGGAHATLIGFQQGASTSALQNILGNVYTGTTTVSWTADDGLYPGEWGHVAYIWDSTNGFLYVYIDGIPCMKQTFTGPRQSPSTGTNGGNDLCVGGSNHNNFTGCLACMRGFEGTRILYFGTPGEYAISGCWPFSPYSYTTNSWIACNFLADYTAPFRRLIPDLSPYGYVDGSGSSRLHPGFLIGSNPAAGGDIGRWGEPSSYPVPVYVNDNTFPFPVSGATPIPPAAGVPNPAPVPPGAKVFDSFSRPNATWAFNNLGLGGTEGGSLGPLTYSTGSNNSGSSTTAYWGILHGAAVNCAAANSVGFSTAWVNIGTSNMDVRVSRKIGINGVGARTALCGQLVDNLNYWLIAAGNPTNTATAQTIYVYSTVAGVTTLMNSGGTAAPATNWIVLRAVFSGTTLTVYCDSTQVLQLTGIGGPTGTQAGLASFNSDGPAAMSGLDRWQNFTVY